MDFKTYFLSLPPDKRKPFAEQVKTSVGHLNNCAYGIATISAALAGRIFTQSGEVVDRRTMRPRDFADIWPNLGRRVKARD